MMLKFSLIRFLTSVLRVLVSIFLYKNMRLSVSLCERERGQPLGSVRL